MANTGGIRIEQKDLNPNSSTYNTIRYIEAIDEVKCPKPVTDTSPAWTETGLTRCQVDGNGANTGYQELEERDTNSASATYNALRWSVGHYNPGACPLPDTETLPAFKMQYYAAQSSQWEVFLKVAPEMGQAMPTEAVTVEGVLSYYIDGWREDRLFSVTHLFSGGTASSGGLGQGDVTNSYTITPDRLDPAEGAIIEGTPYINNVPTRYRLEYQSI
jgi:hypothetical protein